MIFSCVIPAKDKNDPKLADLIDSIRKQDFPQDKIEIIVETEGDSEQAKASAIRKAKGDICVMLCADNYFNDLSTFRYVWELFRKYEVAGAYSKFYTHIRSDNSINRYFSLMGNNDPVCFYLGKSDRRPHYENDRNELLTFFYFRDEIPSFGDNAFFYRRSEILKSDLDNYYPMDNAKDLQSKGKPVYARFNCAMLWHRTSDSYFGFLRKRYRYARDLYCDRTNRRWKMLDTRKDYWRLLLFILRVIAVIPIVCTSIRGYRRVKDPAWFWHYPVCFGFLVTYGILAIRNLFKHGNLFQKNAVS